MKITKTTTALLCATFGTLGTGIGSSIYLARTVGSACTTGIQFFVNIAMGNLTFIPPAFNTTTTLPNLTASATVYGQSINATIAGGQELNSFTRIPAMVISLGESLGTNVTEILQAAPEDIGGYCHKGTLAAGLICTGLATGLLGLLAYSYENNARLRAELNRLKDTAPDISMRSLSAA